MTGARVLVVDDEPQMLRSLRLILSGNGFDVSAAPTGEAALDEFARHIPDVVLLDLMLPGIDGLDVCRWIRERSSVPIVVLSAQGDEQMKIQALDLGADDYLTKPFGAGELLARIRVALRHAAGTRTAPAFTIGKIEVDFERRRVTVDDRDVVLTPKEYDVLKFMVSNADRVLTHTAILRAVWGPEYMSESQYLRNVILSLRRKLELDPSHPEYLITEPGVGYRFNVLRDA